MAMTLRSNYHLVLNHKANGPTEFSVDPLRSTCGSDGGGALTCKIRVVMFLPRYIVKNQISEIESYTHILSHCQTAPQGSITS